MHGGYALLLFSGGAGQATAADLPGSLLEAVVAFIRASDTATGFSGGITSGKAADTARVPYVVAREQSSGEELHTSDFVVHDVTLEVCVYHNTEDGAGVLGDALTKEIAADGGARFPFTDGTTTAATRKGEPRHKVMGRTHDGKPLWAQEQLWRVRVIRAK